MIKECIDIDRIPEVLELPADDPRRRHLSECPRCSSVLLSYQAFLEAEALPGSDTADAEARLRASVQSMIEESSGDPSMARSVRERPGFLAEIVRGFFLRPAWVAAALVIIAAGIMLWRPWVQDRPALRGTSPESELGRPLGLEAPQLLEDGNLRLAWQPLEGADSYHVCLYDRDLSELIRFGPVSETTLVLRRSMLPADAPATMLWRIIALDEGDEIAVSPPALLEF